MVRVGLRVKLGAKRHESGDSIEVAVSSARVAAPDTETGTRFGPLSNHRGTLDVGTCSRERPSRTAHVGTSHRYTGDTRRLTVSISRTDGLRPPERSCCANASRPHI